MLKLNVGFNRKVGEANYGSRGASVNLELELDSGLVGDADRLKDRIRQLFTLAKESVNDELNGHAAPVENGNGHHANGNGHNNGNGQRREPARKATASQVRAIYTIADRNGVELADKLRADFGVDSPDQLSISEASSLIDELKGAVSGNGHGAKR